MTGGKRSIIQQLLQEWDFHPSENIQEALKDLFGRTIKEMMGAEMDMYLRYGRSERSDNENYNKVIQALCKYKQRLTRLDL